MIKLKNVSFSYKNKKIFENFNFSIEKGERICLFAPSGHGKTTLLRIILGLEKINKGELQIEENTKFSVCFQEDRLLPHKTVQENVALFGEADKALKLLCGLGLENALDLYPAALSGGMARRVSIARALIKDFDVLILDEPFTGLDRENTEAAANFILQNSKDKTILLITHSKFEAGLLNSNIVEI